MSSVSQPTSEVFGHKPGLFLLFFTEMWERFSYYGMRALLVLFLVSELASGGWGWSRENALQLYAWYTGLVYLTPILGGIAADKILGHRWAVLIGALLMTLGHASMAMETQTFFYLGLFLLIIGNGFFKPNISTMVGQLYFDESAKKDAAYTIFYMGINAGAFLGILLCGYIGEKVGWSWGFGLAGIFMFLGMLMFQFGGKLLPDPNRDLAEKSNDDSPSTVGEEPDSKTIERDRLIVIAILSCSTIFFWMAFEQAGGSMTIFARDYTGRVLTGGWATGFFWANTLLTVVPLAVVTYVLYDLVRKTFGHIPLSNAFICFSFVLIWIIALWMLNKEFNMKAYEVTIAGTDGPINATIRADQEFSDGQTIRVLDLEGKGGTGKLRIIDPDAGGEFDGDVEATIVKEKANETEVPASWFGILNSFYIIAFAPILTKIWESRWNPSAPVKFGIGLILLGLGFGALVIGSGGIAKGAANASVSIWWLITAYWFHTMGELCVSPVGLSYVSKLAPARLVGLMFGVWFGATAIANYAAGFSGSFIDSVSEKYGLTTFFLIYTILPIAAGVVMWMLNGWLKKKMHGIT